MGGCLKKSGGTEGEEVFFSAALTTSHHDHPAYPEGSPVVFDLVFANVGSCYDPQTGLFTCRVSGYYRFDIHLRNMDNKPAAVTIMYNEHPVVDAFIHTKKGVEQASNTVIIYVDKGVKIKVVTFLPKTYIYSTAKIKQVTFTGHLICKTNCDDKAKKSWQYQGAGDAKKN